MNIKKSATGLKTTAVEKNPSNGCGWNKDNSVWGSVISAYPVGIREESDNKLNSIVLYCKVLKYHIFVPKNLVTYEYLRLCQ